MTQSWTKIYNSDHRRRPQDKNRPKEEDDPLWPHEEMKKQNGGLIVRLTNPLKNLFAINRWLNRCCLGSSLLPKYTLRISVDEKETQRRTFNSLLSTSRVIDEICGPC